MGYVCVRCKLAAVVSGTCHRCLRRFVWGK